METIQTWPQAGRRVAAGDDHPERAEVARGEALRALVEQLPSIEHDGVQWVNKTAVLLAQCDALLASLPAEGWRDIATAPERRKVLVTWANSHGKKRQIAMASWWPEGTLDMEDDVPDWQVTEEGKNLDAGWWEESEGNEEAMFRLVEPIDYWMPLPAPPSGTLEGGTDV